MDEKVHLHPWYKAVLLLLNEMGVEYLLVGGYAARFYGVRRETRDLDLWVPPEPANAAQIARGLERVFGEVPQQVIQALSQPWRIVRLKLPPPTIEIVEPVIGQKAIVMESLPGNQPHEVEFLTIQTGLDFTSAYKNHEVADLEGIPVPIVSLADLKIIKKTGNRPKDQSDLEQLK